MSYFEDASLVLIPSAQKTSKVYSVKPTDGSGDLVFTRSNDTATRVGPDGLIEKVRTNTLTYSQDFTNAAWTKSNVSATGGQTDPNGGTTASLVQTTTASSAYFYQTQSGAKAFSIYAKAGTKSNFAIINGLYNQGAGFNLSTQVATSAGAGSLAKIEDVGGGWFRCSVYVSSSTEMIIMLADVSGGGMSVGDNMYFAFAQAETGDIATDYIATTSAAVSVGPVANVPRLDYAPTLGQSGVSCPRLILEGQRTNALLFSEQMDNANWIKNVNAAVTANQAISPDGYQNADLVSNTLVGGGMDYYQLVTGSAATTYTYSVFVKAATHTKCALRAFVGASSPFTTTPAAYFDLATASVIQSYGSATNAKIEAVGSNGWYRVSMTFPTIGTAHYLNLFPLSDSYGTSASNAPINYSSTGGVYFWGAQYEVGAYATSYIPTLGAAVTRGADACSKTGISSLIGQTEGTIFVDFNHDISVTAAADSRIQLSDGTAANWIFIGFPDGGTKLLRMYVNNTSGALSFFSNTGVIQGRNKAAFAYKSGDFMVYLNGVQVASNTTAHVIPPCSAINLQGGSPTAVTAERENINQALLFKTRLTNAQLAELTTL